jgi:hypothetical protein
MLSRTPIVALSLALAACATSLNRDGAVSVVPYDVQPSGRIVTDVLINEQGPFRFAVDTAATGSFIVARVRDELALVPLPDATATVYGAVASGSYPIVRIDRLTIGDTSWLGAPLIALPAGTGATATIDGVLGADFLRQYSVEIVSANRELRLFRPETIGERNYRGWASIAIEPRYFGTSEEPLHFLEVEIEGYRIPALLDLGAGVSVLNTPAVRALHLAPTRRSERGEFSGALGSEEIIAHLGTQALKTGTVAWRNESFLIADPEIFATLDYAERPLAILGSGLFTQRDFIIDYARDRLLIRTSMSELE